MSPDCNVGTIAFGRGRFDSIGWQERGIAVSPNVASGAVAAMAPLGDALVIAVNYSRQHVTYGPPRACTQYEQLLTDSLGNPLLCADRIQANTSDHVAFHRFARYGAGFVPLTGPSASALASGKTVNWIALNERGTELVISTSTTAVQTY